MLSGRYEDAREAKFLRLMNTLVQPVDRTYLSRKTHFAGQADAPVERYVHIRRENSSHNSKVDSRIIDTYASRDIEEDIFLQEFKPYPFLKHGKEHIEPAHIKACRGTLWCAVGC